MKKLIALFLNISFLVMNCATYEKGKGINLEPGQKPGAKVIIQKIDGQQARGELIAVKQNSLLLKESELGTDVNVEVRDIAAIKIEKKSKALLGAVPGLLIGVGVVIYTYAEGTEGEGMTTNEWAAFNFITTGVPAILLGVLIGGIIGLDKTIQIEGKSDSEIKDILEDLSKKARVPDFQ